MNKFRFLTILVIIVLVSFSLYLFVLSFVGNIPQNKWGIFEFISGMLVLFCSGLWITINPLENLIKREDNEKKERKRLEAYNQKSKELEFKSFMEKIK